MRFQRMVYAGTLVVAAMTLSRAAQFRFQEKEQAFRQVCKDQLQKLGITRDAAKAKYPTPEIHLVSGGGCLVPGATGEVVVKGKFVPETKFLFTNDNLEVVKETLAGNEYRATVRVAADIRPRGRGCHGDYPGDRHYRAQLRRRGHRWEVRVESGGSQWLEDRGALAGPQGV